MNLFKNIFPKFYKGRILKIEMLENLRDYPRDFTDIYFDRFSNGIICGGNLIIGEKEITITKGIIKYNKKLYMMKNETSIPYCAWNKECVIKVKFSDEDVEKDFDINGTEIYIDEDTNIEKHELELGRFKLKEGAMLRDDYVDFEDFSTEYNTVNIINVEYAAPNRSTIHPNILKYFSTAILKNKVNNSQDIAFAMRCMNEDAVDRILILLYISSRLGMEYKEYSNKQIYKYLCQILREGESGIRRTENRRNRQSKIIVD